ncbi:MAG: ADOP family duplicated permease [Vicinamibacteria bacterium]
MKIWRRLLFYFRRDQFERDLQEEMRIHVEMKLDQNLASGMAAEEARLNAEREFGNRTRLMEGSRETWSFLFLETLYDDVRLGLRALRTRPGFTAVALVSLALGIGANTAVFTVINKAFLRPLPVADPEELVSLSNDGNRHMFPTFSYPNYEDFRDRNDVFSGLVAYRFAPLSVSHDGVAERMWGYVVSGNYFEVLGLQAALGRLLSVDDDRMPGGHPVAVVSYRSWQGRFGGKADVLGKDVLVNGRTYSIIGVAPPGFDGTEILVAPEIFLPMAMQAEIEPGRAWLEDRATEPIFLQGRLAPGIELERAQASIDAIALELEREHSRINEGKRVSLSPPGLLSGRMRSGLLGFSGVLMTVVGFALLLTCTNLANLLLARASERRREIGISIALGARRPRLIQRLLTECIALALGGGVLGLLLALWLVRLIGVLRPSADIPIAYELQVDYRVLGFTLLTSIVAGLLFGLLPALRITRVEPLAALQDELAGGASGKWSRGSPLVVFQIALSLVLLVASGLAIQGLKRAQALDLGFDPERAVEVSLALNLQGYDEARGREFQRRVLERLRTLPGVLSVGIADFVPVDLHFARTRLFVEGEPVPRRIDEAPLTLFSRVSPGYLSAMSTRLSKGRDFSDADDENAIGVAIVNEALAQRFWPGEDPIAKRLALRSPDAPKLEVVGVARNGKYAGLNEQPQPFVYLPIRQSYSGTTTVVARGDGDPARLLPSIRAEIQRLDPELPVFAARKLSERLALPLFPARIAASLLGSFALLSLALAAIGIYGVMSQVMSRRRREIGIRIALGARQVDVLKLLMQAGMVPTFLGLAGGAAAALALTRWMTSLLYGVSPRDPWTFASTAALLATVAALACFVPARSAAAAAPTASLRAE